MRVFLLACFGGVERVSVEVLSYDKRTSVMRVRCANGIEYDRVFLRNSRYNQQDFRFATLEDDHAQLHKNTR